MRFVTRAFMHDPYPTLRSLRERLDGVVLTEQNGYRTWVVTRYDHARSILGDRAVVKDIVANLQRVAAQNLVEPERTVTLPRRLRRGVLDRDGADHRRLRRLIGETFRPRRVAAFQPRIDRIVDGLLSALPTGEPVDLVDRFTRPLASSVISEILGVPPGHRDEFPLWENVIFTGTDRTEIEVAGRRMDAFSRDLIALKRAQPQADLLTGLVRAHAAGRLDEDELASTFANLLIGGMEPSTAVGSGIALLLTHECQLARLLEDRGRLVDCVEEILRYETPFRIMAPRWSENDIHLDGVTIPAGELVAICPAAANRDPRRFPDPDTFDVTRETRGHLAFGYGPHHCVGVHLARAEITTALQRFFTRFPNSRLAVAWDELVWRPGAYMRRLDSLPVIPG